MPSHEHIRMALKPKIVMLLKLRCGCECSQQGAGGGEGRHGPYLHLLRFTHSRHVVPVRGFAFPRIKAELVVAMVKLEVVDLDRLVVAIHCSGETDDTGSLRRMCTPKARTVDSMQPERRVSLRGVEYWHAGWTIVLAMRNNTKEGPWGLERCCGSSIRLTAVLCVGEKQQCRDSNSASCFANTCWVTTGRHRPLAHLGSLSEHLMQPWNVWGWP